MDLSFNLALSYRDLKDPTSRQNFDDTVEHKRVIDLRACHISKSNNLKSNNMLVPTTNVAGCLFCFWLVCQLV